MNATILHSAVLIVGIIAYVVLTALGHDGNTVLSATLGYAGGAGVSKVASDVKS